MLNRSYLDFIDEEQYYGEINGLRVYVIPKKGYSKSFAMITTKYGSNDIKFALNNEDFKEYPLGIAHFLEHKLFEEKEGNIFNKFSLLGASPNAYTNFKVTAYYFTCTNSFNENLELLLKFVYNPYFTDENVEKEKGIIEQEIRMYDDNPGFKVYFNALSAMYKNHPVKNDIAGSVESIHKINKDLLYQCYNAFYVPKNMILSVVGDVDIKTIEEIASKFVPLDRGDVNFKRFNFESDQGIVKNEVNHEMGLSIPNFIIGFKEDSGNLSQKEVLEKRVSMDIISKIIFSRSSDIYETLYNKGLINDSFSYDYICEEDYSYFIIGGESKDPKEVKEILLNEMNMLKNKKISEKDFDRVKKVLIGAFVSKFNSVEGLGNSLSDYSIRDLSLFDYYDILKQINREKIEEDINSIFKEKNCILSVVK